MKTQSWESWALIYSQSCPVGARRREEVTFTFLVQVRRSEERSEMWNAEILLADNAWLLFILTRYFAPRSLRSA